MRSVCVYVLATVAALVGSAARGAGPDVIVGELYQLTAYEPVAGVGAYSLGTVSCNIGNAQLLWIPNTNQHPVIAQSLYRVKDGRIEQLGMSWLKHAYTSTNGNFCNTCFNPGSFQRLGIGCSDPYTGPINGDQWSLGPRSEVNAFTGVFAFPFGLGWQQSGTTIFKRIQVAQTGLDPAQNAGALYFAEAQYITADDAQSGNGLNNASYRRFTVGAFNNGIWPLTFVESTQQTKPVIYAWRERTGGVSADDDTSVTITPVDIPGEGRLFLGSKVTDLGGGQWRYDYAIQNLNSHRSAGALSIPVGVGTVVSQTSFSGVAYHSGEPFSSAPWDVAASAGVLTWACVPHATDPNANALRWGTLYSYRFIADRPPTTGTVSIGLFRPGSPSSVDVVAPVPTPPPPPACGGDANGDLVVNGADLSVLLGQFGAAVTPGAGADFNNDGTVNGADLSVLLGRFGESC